MFLDLFVRLFLCTKLSVEIRDSAYSETAIDHNFRLKSNPLSTVYNFFPWHNLSSGYDTCAICVCIFIIFVLLSFHNRILIITFKLTSPVTAAAAKKKATSRPDSSRGRSGDVRRGLCAHKPRVGVMHRLLVAHRWKGYRQRTASRATRHAHLVGCANPLESGHALGGGWGSEGKGKRTKGKKKNLSSTLVFHCCPIVACMISLLRITKTKPKQIIIIFTFIFTCLSEAS